jgi:hypothetical protein
MTVDEIIARNCKGLGIYAQEESKIKMMALGRTVGRRKRRRGRRLFEQCKFSTQFCKEEDISIERGCSSPSSTVHKTMRNSDHDHH